MGRAKSKVSEILEHDPSPANTKMKAFVHDPNDEHPDFAWVRYWYENDADRASVRDWVEGKRAPGDHPKFGHSARTEVLLPSKAPADYANIDFLTRRFDETLPPFEKHALVQAKIMLEDDEAWHVGYERVRSFARAHFAQRFAVILIAHIPGTAGLKGQGNHVHCAVLSRTININGFGGACTTLCSDRGYEAATAAWQEHKASWEVPA
ncbi:hypothetical protein [Qipengyuania qiaonensis]|uniref:MobA/MobL protein domain-containing protein n=1 Tax=Qipengyuania qiaonensis TaxID=2867240 RepID=A0ABS7JA40_9SPHN|nr:hypothetical protein [Qipengyuania qiaonensis]MBX7484175.1 hypothetical protein [Qipengyuania qiaonensis]